MIIAISHEKGGVGKSVLSICLAKELLQLVGGPVRIIDADPQRSAADWFSRAQEHGTEGLELVEFPHPTLHEHDLGEGISIIDCPGRLDAVVRSAMVAADVLLVPMPLSYFAAETLPKLQRTIAQAEETRGKPLRVAVAINMLRLGTELAREVDSLAAGLPVGFHLLKAQVRLAADFERALRRGLVPAELHASGNAASDVRALGRELAAFLGYAPSRRRSARKEVQAHV
jgi:chromosome partitioning protein